MNLIQIFLEYEHVAFENNQEFFVANVTDIKGGDFGSQRIAGIRAYDQMKSAIVEQLEKKLFNL